jgi:hypothetical protein
MCVRVCMYVCMYVCVYVRVRVLIMDLHREPIRAVYSEAGDSASYAGRVLFTFKYRESGSIFSVSVCPYESDYVEILLASKHNSNAHHGRDSY